MKRLIRHQSQSGLTLIESAISITILGLMLAAVVNLYDAARQQNQPRTTEHKMKTIVKALSTYVETSGRLPCPANPAANDVSFGWEWNVTAAMAETDAGAPPAGFCNLNGAGSVTGIVPFQTLNLPPEIAIDGWGNYFTYAVSPIFTLDMDANPPDFSNPPSFTPGARPTEQRVLGAAGRNIMTSNDEAHARCRDGAWTSDQDNLNTVKARFCCAYDPNIGTYFDPATDIAIQLHTAAGVNISPQRVDVGDVANTNDDNYAPLGDVNRDTILQRTERTIESTENITAPAFVLVSHGPDGRGPFLANGTNNRNLVDATFVRQAENWDNDRIYFTGVSNLGVNVATYFDDMVLWMTQDGIMAANGTSSCQYP